MDFWDLTRLMLRRWYVAAPMIFVTFMLAGWVAVTVKPDYRATGQLQLVPPQVASDDATRAGKSRNPWVDLGLEAVAQAAAVVVTQPDVIEELTAEGYTENYTVTLHDDFPILVIEATGNTAAQATSTVKRLTDLASAEVISQQKQSQPNLAENQLITTRALSRGETTEAVTTSLKRILIVVVAGSLLLTAALTVAVDAFLRRRSNRLARFEQESAEKPRLDRDTSTRVLSRGTVTVAAREPVAVSAHEVMEDLPETTETTRLELPRDGRISATPKPLVPRIPTPKPPAPAKISATATASAAPVAPVLPTQEPTNGGAPIIPATAKSVVSKEEPPTNGSSSNGGRREASGITVAYQLASQPDVDAEPVHDVEDEEPEEPSIPIPYGQLPPNLEADSTVVLPLSGVSWHIKRTRDGKRN